MRYWNYVKRLEKNTPVQFVRVWHSDNNKEYLSHQELFLEIKNDVLAALNDKLSTTQH